MAADRRESKAANQARSTGPEAENRTANQVGEENLSGTQGESST